MISDESELAQMIVASTPCLPVKSRMRRFHSGSRGSTTSDAPASRASSLALGLTSMPTTTQPAARAIRAHELADEAEPVDRDVLAELEVGAAQGLDGDAADRDERGVAQVDVGRARARRG